MNVEKLIEENIGNYIRIGFHDINDEYISGHYCPQCTENENEHDEYCPDANNCHQNPTGEHIIGLPGYVCAFEITDEGVDFNSYTLLQGGEFIIFEGIENNEIDIPEGVYVLPTKIIATS